MTKSAVADIISLKYVHMLCLCCAFLSKEEEELWWFVDGVQCGKTVGLEPFVLQMEKGEHFIVAVNAEGESASLNVVVR